MKTIDLKDLDKNDLLEMAGKEIKRIEEFSVEQFFMALDDTKGRVCYLVLSEDGQTFGIFYSEEQAIRRMEDIYRFTKLMRRAA